MTQATSCMTEQDNMLTSWNDLTDSSKNEEAVIFWLVNVATGEIAEGAPPADLETLLAESEIENIDRLRQSILNSGKFRNCDSLLVSDGMIIGTSTQKCLEWDQELHRRSDFAGLYYDDGETIRYEEQPQLSPLSRARRIKGRFLSEAAVTVVIHDAEKKASMELNYSGSFEIHAEDLLDHGILKDFAGDEEAKLVCDLHEGAGGLKSYTVSRHESGPEGASRHIIFSDLRS